MKKLTIKIKRETFLTLIDFIKPCESVLNVRAIGNEPNYSHLVVATVLAEMYIRICFQFAKSEVAGHKDKFVFKISRSEALAILAYWSGTEISNRQFAFLAETINFIHQKTT